MPRGPQTPSKSELHAVQWPWDDRGRSLVTPESIKRDMRNLETLMLVHFPKGLPEVRVGVVPCP